jgi:hypothetical protein
MIQEKNSSFSETPSDKPTASVSASKPSDNHKDTVAPPSSSSSKISAIINIFYK